MAIYTTISNSLENLASKFNEQLKNPTDVFAKEHIVVQTEGLKKWLSLFISRNSDKKIFANFAFDNPNGFFDRIFKKLDNSHEEYLLQKGYMKWNIYDILTDKTFENDEDFKTINTYCNNDKIKILRLSDKIADLFDQYFIYREDMIKAWNKNELWDKIGGEKYKEIQKWQIKIYQELKRRIAIRRKEDGEFSKDRVQLKDSLLQELENENSLIVQELKKMKTVTFFGLSIITTYHFSLIEKISKYIDCHFYLLNPSGQYWYDIEQDKSILRKLSKGQNVISEKSENNFLANYGKSGQEFFNILFKNEETLNNLDDFLFEEDFEETILGSIQQTIFNADTTAQNSSENISKNSEKFRSLEISSCYTVYREVEVFYDYILSLFNNDKDLKPSDVLVLCPKLEDYAPYIEAVFSKKQNGKKIPFTITDKNFSIDNSPFTVFTEILQLSRTSCEAEKIISIAENKFVQKKYGFEDFDTIRKIVKTSAIRWGINGEQLEKDGTKDFNIFTSWENGLKRIIYGYAMQIEDDFVLDENENKVYPIDIVEGTTALDGLRLLAFIDDLKDFFEKAKETKNLTDWATFIKTQFEKFIALEIKEDKYTQELEKMLIFYNSTAITCKFSVVLDDLLTIIKNTKDTSGFYSGAISFCSMIPMRSIPYKVIAMLGMDEQSFPGRVQKTTFDLMQDKKEIGDRDSKLSNRYLFLEGIISAQKNLYLSYIGRSSKNNKKLNPSPAIEDLISYMAEIFKKSEEEIKKAFVTEYPLFGYGEKYRNGELITYIDDNDIYLKPQKEKQESSVKNTAENCEKSIVLTIKSIIDFYKNAPKWYCNNVLGVYFNEDDILLKNEEVFETDHLTKWAIKDSFFNQNDTVKLIEKFQKQDASIPLGYLGMAVVEKEEKELKNAIEKFNELTENKEQKVVNLSYQNEFCNNIEGSVTLFDDDFIGYNVSKKAYKAQLEFYINYLFLMANEYDVNSVFIDKESSFELRKISKEGAQEKLDELIKTLVENKDNPYPFDITVAGKFNGRREKNFTKLNKDLNSLKEDKNNLGEYFNRMLPDFEYKEVDFQKFERVLKMTIGNMEHLKGDKK